MKKRTTKRTTKRNPRTATANMQTAAPVEEVKNVEAAVEEAAVEATPDVLDGKMNAPEETPAAVVEVPAAKETTAAEEAVVETPAAEKPKQTRTKISEISLELFETNVTLSDLEAAVKKSASGKKLKGDIKIYINAEERAAYYTVDGVGADDQKISLAELAQ